MARSLPIERVRAIYEVFEMAIILFKKGTGAPVKMNEFGFEHSVASGNYFLTKDEAINAGRIPAAPPVEFPFSTPPLSAAEHENPAEFTFSAPNPLADHGHEDMETEDEIRLRAKEAGIKQWWTKKPENLLKEMAGDNES